MSNKSNPSSTQNLVKSTQTQYYFDPKIVTLGKPKFDSHLNGGRISEEEFLDVRKRMIRAGGLNLWLVKWLFTTTIIFIFLLVICYFIIVVYQHPESGYISWKDTLVYSTIVLVSAIFGRCLWQRAFKKAHGNMDNLLQIETNKVYANRGVVWKIDEDLKFMHVHLTNGSKYMPPKHLNISLPVYENQQSSQNNATKLENDNL